MRASEWQYLCAVHDPPKSCCAIDYCCHTLDWAANTLTSPRHFPSRLALGTTSPDVAVGGSPANAATSAVGAAGTGVTRQHQERQLTNVFRRVYRIFAHAWFQHRDVFWRVEGRTGLYILFKTVCDSYALIPDDNYTIPREAEGLEGAGEVADLKRGDREEAEKGATNASGKENDDHTTSAKTSFRLTSTPTAILQKDADPADLTTTDAGATARRHRHAPSKSGTSVSTVIEENEEDDPNSHKRQDSVIQIAERPVISEPAEERGTADKSNTNELEGTTLVGPWPGNSAERTLPMFTPQDLDPQVQESTGAGHGTEEMGDVGGSEGENAGGGEETDTRSPANPGEPPSVEDSNASSAVSDTPDSVQQHQPEA